MALFTDGMEECNFITTWTGSSVWGVTLVCSEDGKNTGTYGARTTESRTVGDRSYVYKNLGSGYDDIYARLYCRIVAKWAESVYNGLFNWLGDSTNATRLNVGISYDGANWKWFVRIRQSDASWINYYSGAVTIDDNTFYCVEVRYKITATANISLWVNGVKVIDVEPADPSAEQIQYVGCGSYIDNAVGSTLTFDWDDFECAESYIGPLVPPSAFTPKYMGIM